MRQSLFKFVIYGCILLFSVSAYGEDDTLSLYMRQWNSRNAMNYEKRIEKYRSGWSRLIPKYAKLQMAGGMGLFSVGLGWDYGKKEQWETDLFLGFLPKYSSDEAKITFTIKQSYNPWSIPLWNRSVSFSPLRCGIYMNTIFDDDFWTREPDRYPKNYYGFSTKLRWHLFLGEQFTFEIPSHRRIRHKSISFYYELSTYDVALISFCTNKALGIKDLMSLSFGFKFKVF